MATVRFCDRHFYFGKRVDAKETGVHRRGGKGERESRPVRRLLGRDQVMA